MNLRLLTSSAVTGVRRCRRSSRQQLALQSPPPPLPRLPALRSYGGEPSCPTAAIHRRLLPVVPTLSPAVRFGRFDLSVRSFAGAAVDENAAPPRKKKKGKGGRAGKGKKSKSKSKRDPTVPPIPYRSPLNGRPILTRRLFESNPLSSEFGLTPKTVLQKGGDLKVRLGWKQRSEESVGLFVSATDGDGEDQWHNRSRGERHFVTVLRTFVPRRILPRMPPGTGAATTTAASSSTDRTHGGSERYLRGWDEEEEMIELVSTGAARTKKEALENSTADLLLQLVEDCGLDVNDPPDIRKELMEERKERLKAEINRAQMMLELVGASRPRVEVRKDGGAKGSWCADLSVRIGGGQLLRANDTRGGSKEEAQANALLAAVYGSQSPSADGEVEFLRDDENFDNVSLTSAVGRKQMEWYERLVERSPGGRVAPLHMRPLSLEAFDVLDEALGTPDDHRDRMERFASTRDAYEAEFRERRRGEGPAGARRGRNGDERYGGDGGSGNADEAAAAAGRHMVAEEKARASAAESDPSAPQAAMAKIREALPIRAMREDLLRALETNQVAVVSGGTGSGKSTQCPQYILEHAISSGAGPETRIIVTQPRRIAAMSVAERVADERDESPGHSVGYAIRLNSVPPRPDGGSIEFVTTGVLLRRLMNDPALQGVSHVVIDEVHERDINTDFLLVLLKDLLNERNDLKLILMSATLDAESFGEYYRGAGTGDCADVPVMSVPAKPRYPVELIHLEDIAGEDRRDGGDSVDDIGGRSMPSQVRRLASDLLRAHDKQLQLDLEEAEAEERAAMQLEKRSEAEDRGILLLSSEDDSSGSETDSDDDNDSDDDSDDDDKLIEGGHHTPRRRRLKSLRRAAAMRRHILSRSSAARVSVTPARATGGRRKSAAVVEREVSDLTVQLVSRVAQNLVQRETDAGRTGSILCFLPGMDEIKAVMAALEANCPQELSNKMTVLPLHSTIPREDQLRVFEPARDGCKVILATNIAESSVTIDDVLCIVDSGLVREMGFDAETSMGIMSTVPTSKASATQRTGRAGRVAPGVCFRLYSAGAFEAMAERPTPEIQRTALEDTCLQTCTMPRTESVGMFLSRALDPPPPKTVQIALDRLEKLGAIAVDKTGDRAFDGGGVEELTSLGRILARLPVDSAIGKMLITGVVMKCLDPTLTAAAVFSSRDPFFNPMGMREEARAARKSFCDDSDLLATVRAHDEFYQILQDRGWNDAKQWANNNFISVNAMTNISSLRSQLLNELVRIGLVHKADLNQSSRGAGGRHMQRQRRNKAELRCDAAVNEHSLNEGLYTAVWAKGLPGNLAARRQLGNFGTLRTQMEDHTGLHPGSVAFHRQPPKSMDGFNGSSGRHIKLPPWFMFKELTMTSQAFLRNCTALSQEQIILFGGYNLKLIRDEDINASGEKRSDEFDVHEDISKLSINSNSTGDGNGHLVLDDWIKVCGGYSMQDTIELLAAVRSEIDMALALKVMHPRKLLPGESEDVVDAVAQMFETFDDEKQL